MKILVIGRTLPNKSDVITGIFEFEQAKGLMEKNYNVFYGFIDNRSIKVMRKIKKTHKVIDGLTTVGYYLPIGGIPKLIFDEIKFRMFKKLFFKITKHYGKVEVIHVHFPLTNFNVRIIEFIKKQNIKIIATEHWSKVQRKAISKREKRILNILFVNSEKIIVVSNKLHKSLEEYNEELGYPYKGEIVVIPNLISSTYNYTEIIDDKNFTFATIGRLVEEKKNNLVIEAFANIAKENNSARLFIIGDGPERQNIIKLINKHGLNDKVILTGYLSSEAIINLFKEINVYISASKLETFGVPVVEAWLIGRPVIVPDNHPMNDWINKSNGLSFKYNFDNEKNTVENIVEKMIEIQKLEYDYKRISDDSVNEFSRDIVLNKLDNVFKVI